MAKRTISSYFLPKPIEKTNPENESDSTCEETVVAKKVNKFSFRDEWLREFTWLRYFRETNSMNCTFCCRFSQHAGNTNFSDKTGTTQLKHDTLIKHNASLKHKMCRDLCNESAAPLRVAFRRKEAANQCAEEAELRLKFNTAYFIAKEELPFTQFKGQLDLQRKNGVKLNATYNNDTACAQFVGIIADTLKRKTYEKIKDAPYLSIMIDGDTDTSTKECEIIYARILQQGKPTNVLIGHIEVQHAHAQGVYDATKEAFKKLGTETGWLDKTVAITHTIARPHE
ncbi:zinc finger protein 862-like [Pseudoliparis swirei]|uniref:zinc finger protein 862-like n=1 Tax=Pseudoliparis swirei TaxID=2059687 RepID=UPI0024BEB601|nr:zinc finger protein 862-like [Pseudoliparis swirei]